jgi:hypothetical protein
MRIIHPGTFLARLSRGQIPSYLLFSVLAYSARHVTEVQDRNKLSSKLSDRARHEIKGVSASLDAIQALYHLSILDVFQNHPARSYMVTSIMFRMAFELELHALDRHFVSNPKDLRQCIELEGKRSIWWCCYISDRTGGFASGLPQMLSDNDVCVHFPSNTSAWLKETPFQHTAPMFDAEHQLFGHHEQGNKHVLFEHASRLPLVDASFMYIVCLNALAGRIAQYVYRNAPNAMGNRHKKMDMAVLQASQKQLAARLFVKNYEFNKLEAAMESFKDALVPYFSLRIEPKDVHQPQTLYLHVFYYTCAMTLYRSQLALPRQPFHSQLSQLAQFYLAKLLEAADKCTDLCWTWYKAGEPFHHAFLSFAVYGAAWMYLDIVLMRDKLNTGYKMLPMLSRNEVPVGVEMTELDAHLVLYFTRCKIILELCALQWDISAASLKALETAVERMQHHKDEGLLQYSSRT